MAAPIHRPLLATIIACFILLVAGFAADAREKKAPPTLKLKVVEKGWGEASTVDVEAVLRSAGMALLENFPGDVIDPIEVAHGKDNPITLFKRKDDGSIAVRLNTADLYWAQYSYQFAHELCHIMCNYCDADADNLFVEESLCELSSMFVLKRMGERWKTDPPYASWKDFAPALTNYADLRIKDALLPDGMSLKEWVEKNRDALRTSKGQDRTRNTIIAAALLPQFEAEPQHWPAVRYLNAHRPKEPQTLQQFIQRWHDQTPDEHQPFVRKIGEQLGVVVKVTSAGSSSSRCLAAAYTSSDRHR